MGATGRQWIAPREHPSLDGGALHVWRADLGTAPGEAGRYLSMAERARLERFSDPVRGARWGRSRAVLRYLLGRYLDADPQGLEFHLNAAGKPALEGGPAFSLSHSAHLALLAFRLDCTVGVDVEVGPRALDELSLASRLLGPEITAALGAMDPEPRRAEFLRAWTRHEAALKCKGTGIGGSPEGPPRSEPWLAQLEPGSEAAGAVAAALEPGRMSLWSFSGTP